MFLHMASLDTYDVKSDHNTVMNALRVRIANMRDKQWQTMCQKTLRVIEDL